MRNYSAASMNYPVRKGDHDSGQEAKSPEEGAKSLETYSQEAELDPR